MGHLFDTALAFRTNKNHGWCGILFVIIIYWCVKAGSPIISSTNQEWAKDIYTP
jgi:hypothetical protein